MEIISTEIKKKIQEKKLINEQLLNFITSELVKCDTDNIENILDNIVDYITINYYTKNEIKIKLIEKLEEKKHNLSTSETMSNQQISNLYVPPMVVLSVEIDKNLRQLFNRLGKNRDLTSLMDTSLHFGNSHMKLAKKIFFLQVTQNYLSALKYFIINDLVIRQTVFNKTTEDTLNNIAGMISKLDRETEISINELKGYDKESEKWIQNNEYRIIQLEKKLDAFVNSNPSMISIMENIEKKFNVHDDLTKTIKDDDLILINKTLRKVEIKTVENYNELKEMVITKDLQSTEFLLEKISKLEEEIKNMKKSSNRDN